MLTDRQKEIILSYAENNMNLLATSRQYHLNHNTIAYHFDSIKKRTGKNPKVFYDLVELVEMVNKDYPKIDLGLRRLK